MTTRGAATTHEPERSLRTQGRRAAEVRATVPDATIARRAVLAPGDAGALVCAAFARALRATPAANASYRDAEIEVHEHVNVGLVVADGAGTALVTLAAADTKDGATIAAERDLLVADVAAGTLTAPQSSGATCSLIDLTGTGAEEHAPVLVAPHAVALAVCDRAADGSISLVLTWDARVLSPFTAAALLDQTVRGAVA